MSIQFLVQNCTIAVTEMFQKKYTVVKLWPFLVICVTVDFPYQLIEH